MAPSILIESDTVITGSSQSTVFTPLQRSFPGYGGAALNDAAINSVYFMTNLNTSGAGSLAAAPSNSYVVPLVAGTIQSDTRFTFNQSNSRVLGQLAPGHLSINGGTTPLFTQLVHVDGSNFSLEYISLRASDPVPVGDSSHKPFTIENGNTGVVLSHISVAYGADDNGAVWGVGTSDITLHRMLSVYPVDRSGFPDPANNNKPGNVPYAFTSGGGAEKMTYFQNVIIGQGRSPLIQNIDNAQVVNNIVYAYGAGVTNQIYAYGAPVRNVKVNFHHNLDIRGDLTASNVWHGDAASTSGTTLELYDADNMYRTPGGSYLQMGRHSSSSVPDKGTFVSTAHPMPGLSIITDLTTLTDILPSIGNSVHRDFIDTAALGIISSGANPNFKVAASDYFADPWAAGPTGTAHTFWDQSSPDGISDAAKAQYGIAAGTNLLSPNDGRWEGLVDALTGGLLSASIS